MTLYYFFIFENHKQMLFRPSFSWKDVFNRFKTFIH